PELPESRRARLQQAYGLSEDAAEAMAVSAAHAVFFEQTVAAAGNAAAAATWIAGELARWMHEATTEIDRIRVTPESLGRLIRLVSAGGVSASAAKQILARMFETGCAPDEVAASEGLLQESDEDALRDLVTRTLDRLPDQVAQYRQGKRAVAGFLVGQVMKASGRRANPALVDRLVRAWLDGPGGG
ncbi:MAG: Asp-tRNA(Asn)/Glu-tRNA(Gln) amidotransferase GatCAB subunit B, partial [Acidobacteria bacterium]|nr:Asp-tRNA(Asn)/Glu-tRNA(Gln) amidotransferase GatCAB subunit B [Acidobacteriota bacterium]